MTPPRKPIELNFEDLLGGGPAAAAEAKTAEVITAEAETGGDLVSVIQGMMEKADAFVTNIKELVAMFRGLNTNPGQGGGPGGGGVQPYTQQPTLSQQLHRLVNILYGVYGDITVAQLLEVLVQQYGGTKLSAVLKALEKLQ